MKFKTLFLSASLLAAASIFSYCTKEAPTAEVAPVVTSTNEDAVSRGGHCSIKIEAAGSDLDICGTQNSLTLCGSAGGVTLTGTGFILDGGNQGYNLNTPTIVRITRSPGGTLNPVTATVSSSNGAQMIYNVPAVGSVLVKIDEICDLF